MRGALYIAVLLILSSISITLPCSSNRDHHTHKDKKYIFHNKIHINTDGPPLVFVSKTPSKKVVKINEWITVTITLTNLGNKTAYDIKVIDENYPEWTIETRNHSTLYLIPILEPNVTIQIRYWLRIKSSTFKNISLGRVIVAYKDANNNDYKSYSEETIISIELKTIEIDIEFVDKILLITTVGVTTSALFGLIIIERKTLKEFLTIKKKR